MRSAVQGTRNSAGFTLLEVMIAVAIMALVLVTLLGVKNRSVEDVGYAERMTVATMLAQRVMTEMLTGAALVPMEDEGKFEEEGFQDFAWKKSVVPTPLPSILEVRVAVLWKEGERQEQVELVSYE